MLSKNIKELRLERGFSQAELAEKIGVTQGAIYFWEKGINEPTAGCLMRMAEVFCVSVDELLSFNAEIKKESFSHSNEMIRLFSRLTDAQREILINTANEFLNK